MTFHILSEDRKYTNRPAVLASLLQHEVLTVFNTIVTRMDTVASILPTSMLREMNNESFAPFWILNYIVTDCGML